MCHAQYKIAGLMELSTLERTGDHPQLEPATAPPLLHRAEMFLALCVALGAIAAIIGAIHNIPRRYQVNYVEGNILNTGALMAHNAVPYPDPHGLPSVISSYGPVTYLLMAGLFKIFGVSFTSARLLVFLSAVAISALLAVAIAKLTGSNWLALLFGPLYISLPWARHWIYTLRVDLIAVALTLAGLTIFIVRPRRWMWAALLFTLGLFTKPTVVAAPAACLIWLLMRKQWKQAAGFSAAMLLTMMVSLLFVERWLGGWYLFHIIGTHPDPYLLYRLYTLEKPFVLTQAVLLVMATGYSVACIRTRTASVPALYFGFCCLTSLTAGKLGADGNHLLELLAATCLAGALGYQQLSKNMRFRRFAPVVPIALAASIMVLAVMRAIPRLDPDRPNFTGCNEAYAFVKDYHGQNMLSENVGALVLGKKPVLISDPYVYGQLVMHSGWSDRELEQLVNAQWFDLIVMSGGTAAMRSRGLEQRWPPDLLPVIDANYRITHQFACQDAEAMFERKEKGR
jgi:hypothetical protein